MDLSDRLPPMIHSEHGIECYYSIQLTGWMTLSPDLQIIMNPGGTSDRDVAVVWGFRVQMNL